MKKMILTMALAAMGCGWAADSGEPHRRLVLVDFATQQVHQWDSADTNQCFAVSVPKAFWDLKKMRAGVYRVVGDGGFKIVDLSARRVVDTFRHPALKDATAVCDLPDGGFVGCVGNPHAKETRLCRFSAKLRVAHVQANIAAEEIGLELRVGMRIGKKSPIYKAYAQNSVAAGEENLADWDYNLVGSVKTDAIHGSDGHVRAIVVKTVEGEDNCLGLGLRSQAHLAKCYADAEAQVREGDFKKLKGLKRRSE